MMKIDNYKEYDTLTLYVKKNKSTGIIKHYKVFGWELVEETDNNAYEDLVDLTFIRSHKIKNKDELQLQQVYMEETLNKLGKLDKFKHAKSASVGLSVGTIILAFIIFAVIINLKYLSVVSIIAGIISSIIIILLIAVEAIIIPKMYKKEREVYKQKRKKLERELSIICKNAIKLTRGEYGQD